MLMEKGALLVRPIAPAGSPAKRAPLLRKLGDPVLEVNNDHFPTAIFKRRIVEVLDPSGPRCLALEEDISLMRLAAVGTVRKTPVFRFTSMSRTSSASDETPTLQSPSVTRRKRLTPPLIKLF